MMYFCRSTLQGTAASYPQVALDQETLAGVRNLFLPHLPLPATTPQSFQDLLLNVPATSKDCTPCTARKLQGPGTPTPNSHPCTDVYKLSVAHQASSPHRPLSHGGQEVPQPLCHPHDQHAAKSPSHNANPPEEILIAAMSNY